MNPRQPSAAQPRRRPPAPHTPLAKWAPAIAAAGVLLIVLVAGLSGRSDSSASSNPPNPGAVNGSDLTVPLTTDVPVVIETDPAVIKSQLSHSLRRGMFGDQVKAVQQRLIALGFDPGGDDGQFGPSTEEAVWAFEKLVLNVQFDKATGVVTNDMWQTMQDPIIIKPRRPGGVGNTHMEIYLDKQVGIVFTDDKPKLITHISSGTGQEWCQIVKQNTDNEGNPLPVPVEQDVCGVSKTPGGVFKFYRRYAGDRQGPLGGMWNPVYFNYGIAVHGAKNVPLTPASHGCIRIPMFIADYFPSLVKNGDRVYVWDGVKEPEAQSKKDMTPIFNRPNPNSTTTSSSTSSSTTTTVVKSTTTTVKPPPTTVKPPPPTTTSVAPPPGTTTTLP